MDQKLLKRLHGSNLFRLIRDGMYWFRWDYSREPSSLSELLAYLEATNADRQQIDDCRRLAVRFEPRP